ncbi:MAG TPA: L,D-transpeptidase family protein [Hyphomicrobium sp.]|nr:L,D-transpeptidase family protein [Hyphomicrobium sp.]
MASVARPHAMLSPWHPISLMLLSLILVPSEAFAAEPDNVQPTVCTKLETDAISAFGAPDRDAVAAFYAGRECKPLWVDRTGPTRAADELIAELKHADEWGLKSSDFAVPSLDALKVSGKWSDDQTLTAELEITAAALRYAHQAQGGRIPQPDTQLSSYIDRQPELSSAEDILVQLSQTPNPGAVLRSLHPRHEQFLRLKGLLAELRGKWNTLPPDQQIARRGTMLQPGMKDAEVAILKRRFGVTSAPGDETLFDPALAEAVKTFQDSASLPADGFVGPMTRNALAGESPEKNAVRIAAVIANMEEWRWMPRSLGDTYILVNVPAFSIRLMRDGKTLFDDRVVVGTAKTQTPIFSKNMKTIVLRPEWNLPDSIKLTALLSGRSIERQGYVVMRNGHTVDSTRVNWGRANLSEYTFYQPAGDDNALGLVKFLFPNKHSVYLHDTPSRYLFDERVRLYSHGCVRVRNPQQLAQKIFDIDRGAAAPDVKSLVRKGPKDNDVALDTPLPVHVGYFTVWVGDNGKAEYFRDFYGHQQRITLALAGQWNRIDVGKDHLAAVDTSALQQVRIRSDVRKRSASKRKYDPPMGLTHDDGRRRYSGDSVGDIILRSLGF